MCFKMGSWHTLSLCDSEMLPGVLAATGTLLFWLQLDWVADGRTIGVVGQGRSCLGKSDGHFSGQSVPWVTVFFNEIVLSPFIYHNYWILRGEELDSKRSGTDHFLGSSATPW